MEAAEIISAEEDVLHTLVIGAQGLPQRVAAACAANRGARELTAEKVRQTMDINWGGPILELWLHLLTEEQDSTLSLPPALDPAKVGIYSRCVLSYLMAALRSFDGVGAGEPALRLASSTERDRLLAAFRNNAKMVGARPEEILIELGETILFDSFSDEGGFAEFQKSIRATLRFS